MATITKQDAKTTLRSMRDDPLRLYREAYQRGMNLSGFLEKIDPSDNPNELDAFGRLLKEAGIRTNSDPYYGYHASWASDFLETPETRALFMEWASRIWRQRQGLSPLGQRNKMHQNRAVYLSSDGTAGSWQNPYAEAQQARWDQDIAPAIPLSELIALSTPIDSDLYKAFYLTYDAEQVRQFRLGESAEIPIAKLTDAERTIQLKKFGRGLQASYEQLRRMRVDKLAMQIAFMAVQAEIDKVAAAIDIIVSGDGNANTAATSYNLTTIDTAASAGTLTLKGWLGFKLKFANPYVITTALMQEAVALQLQLLATANANVPMVSLSGNGFIGGVTPINMTGDNVRFGWDSNVAALTIVGFDSRRALEYVTETGSEISESERFITNQTQIMTITEVNGFAVLDQNASNVLDVNA